jgi:hypothetical protein
LLALIDYFQTVAGSITCSAIKMRWMNIAFRCFSGYLDTSLSARIIPSASLNYLGSQWLCLMIFI